MNTLIGISLLSIAVVTIKLIEITPEKSRTLIILSILTVAAFTIVLGLSFLFKGLSLLLIQLN